ncbi:MAG: hypothetical protein JW779_14970 [Candidatus Thorarchaeota archaeon]|nr:hypothetical protein [Candidatus Thorarchaeota archaeon]
MSEDFDLIDILAGFILFLPFRGAITFFQAVYAVAKYFGKRKPEKKKIVVENALNQIKANLDQIANLTLTDLSCPIDDIVKRNIDFENPLVNISTSLENSSLRGIYIKKYESVHPHIAYCYAASDFSRKLIESLCVRISKSVDDRHVIIVMLQVKEILKTIQMVTKRIKELSSEDEKVSSDILSERFLNEICHLDIAKRLVETYGFAFIPAHLTNTEYLENPLVLRALFEDHLLEFLNDHPQTNLNQLAKGLNIKEELCRTLFLSLEFDSEVHPLLLKNDEIWHSAILLENLMNETMRNPKEIVKWADDLGIDYALASSLLIDGMIQQVSDSLVK